MANQPVTKNKFDYNEIDMEALFIQPFTIPQCSNKHAQQVPKNKFGYNEIDMEAFYASFESLETPSASQLSLKSTRFSEKTNNAIHTLQALLSKELSFLLRPIYSTMIKITIEYLLALPQNYTTFTYIRPPAVPSFSSLGLSTSCVLGGGVSRNEAISMTKTKSELQHLLQCFELWSVEYRNALSLSETTKAELSKASEVTNDLEANVKDFKVLDNDEKLVCNKLACFQERKRKLKKEINIIDVQIANSTKKRHEIAKRKTELFVKGKVLKAEQDDVRIHVPRQKAEQELAEKTRYNIEAEWSKLQQQFI